MRKYFILSQLVLVIFLLYGQKTQFPPGYSAKGTIAVSSHFKDLQNINDVLWVNDFSVPSNWVISNTTSDNQNWIITNSSPQGTYSSPLGIIGSTTSTNGFALFDSDFLGTNGGYQDASIATSAPLNLTNKIDVSVIFQQKYRRYLTDQTFIGISVNGTSWTDFEVNTSLPDGDITTSPVTVDVSSVADNHSQVWLRFHYVGEWDYAWMVDDVQINGIDNPNPPLITNVSPDQAHQNQTLTVSISGQNTHFSQGNENIWFNQGSSTIFYGTSNIVSNSTLLSTGLSLPYNAPTGYYDVNVQNSTDGLITFVNGFLVNTWAPNWGYNITGNSHSIIIPNYATITIDSQPVDPGDYIGVFYDQGGILVCGGYMQYTGINSSIIAYGASGGDNGFNTGETFLWKVWDATAEITYPATATYIISGFPNTGTFAINGQSAISGLAAATVSTQIIDVPQGWSIISTFINPTNPSISAVLSPLTNLVICKNSYGQVYWPFYNINQINNMVIGEGYQLNNSVSGLLPVQGIAVVPENTPLNLPGTWSIIGYLRQSPGLIEDILSPIVSSLMIVKDYSGMVYWPVWGVNGIIYMQPGQGYQIRMTAPVVFTYPPNSISAAKYSVFQHYQFFSGIINTGNNMTLCIPKSCIENLPANNRIKHGDEIGIFSNDGLLAGAGVYNEGNIAITIWGDDELTTTKDGLISGDEFIVKAWFSEQGCTENIQVTDWAEGYGQYEVNGLSIVGSLNVIDDFYLCQNTPNPADNFTELSFSLPENLTVEVTVRNIFGELVWNSGIKNYVIGRNSLIINTSGLPEGNYFYILKTPGKSVARKFIIMR